MHAHVLQNQPIECLLWDSMVRQAEHIRDCATQDADYTRVQRKEHEQSFTHIGAHSVYRAAFGESRIARYERLVEEAAVRTEQTRREFERTLLAPAQVPGVYGLKEWLDILPSECTDLKAMLFDHACRVGPDPGQRAHTHTFRLIVEKHVRLAQHILLLKAAQEILGDADGRATLVAGLCRPFLEDKIA